jgi:hypothetical protein
MRFVLAYTGPLPSNGNPEAKHRIRKALLPQLKEQWSIDPALKQLSTPDGKTGLSIADNIKKKFARKGFNFLPLVLREFSLVCYLEITMMRREEPGNVLQSGGDIDNRLKTLFDSLSQPVKDEQVWGQPAKGEDPFYCLLEDDSLVTGMEIKTERLLEQPQNPNDVRLAITAIVRPTKVDVHNLSFLGGWL